MVYSIQLAMHLLGSIHFFQEHGHCQNRRGGLSWSLARWGGGEEGDIPAVTHLTPYSLGWTIMSQISICICIGIRVRVLWVGIKEGEKARSTVIIIS